MLGSLFSSPSITITLEEDQFFCHPISADSPTADPVLRGTALVTLPSRRAIRKFKVILEGLCDVFDAFGGSGGRSGESILTLHKELEQDFGGEVFEAGDHAFNFSFIIPSSTAVSQRCIYGRIRHYVKARVDFDGGLLGSSFSSAPTALWLSVNPSPPGELPYPTDVSFQHYSDDLGPVGIGVTSPHLTVAALCNIRLTLLGPPKPVSIVSVNGMITQNFEIHHSDGRIARPKPRDFVLKKVDSSASPSLFVRVHDPTCTANTAQAGIEALPAAPQDATPTDIAAPATPDPCCPILPDKPIADPYPLAIVQAGQELHFSRIVRVPDDDHVRPSTLEATETRIRASHKMSVQVRYRKEGEEEDILLTIGKPVTITSCCCLIDSLYLPAYSAAAPKTISRPLVLRCACNMTLKECFDRDGAALQRAGAIPAPSTRPRLLGIDGLTLVNPDTKSPSWTDGSSGTLTPISPTSTLASTWASSSVSASASGSPVTCVSQDSGYQQPRGRRGEGFEEGGG